MPGGDPSQWSDEELARRCAGRGQEAWVELLRRAGPYAKAMMRRVFLRAGVPDPGREAEEALGDLVEALLEQDQALLRAYRARRAPLATYLAVVARSIAVRIVRRRKPALPLGALDDVEAPDGLSGELASEVPRHTPAQLELALASLRPRDRLLLKLAYWRGLRYAEIAPLAGVPASHVGPLMTRAREQLRKAMEAK